MTSAAPGRTSRKVVYEPDRTKCTAMAEALKEAVRRVPGIEADADFLLSASSRFRDNQEGFRKYKNRHANIISDADFFGRIEESNALTRVLAGRVPLELKPPLETAKGMLLDFSGVNLSRRAIADVDGNVTRHVIVAGGDFTNSVWDSSRVDSFEFSACKFNGASWNNIDVARCVLVECEGYAIDLQHATIHDSVLEHVKWGFANTEELGVYGAIIRGLSLGDFPREQGTYYGREIVVRSSIATAHFLGPMARNSGLETVSFEGEVFATEAQRSMLLELRRSKGVADNDIRHLVFTVKEVQRSAETAGPADRVYKSANGYSTERMTKPSDS